MTPMTAASSEKRDDDMPDVEGDRVVRGPDGEDVGAGRFLLAADDAADGTGPLVDEVGESLAR